MYRFKNLMVGLTVGDRDRAKIRYAGLVSWLASSEKITFGHVVSSAELPDKAHLNPEILEQIRSGTNHSMEALVDKYYDGRPGAKLEYEVFFEKPLIEIDILRQFKEREIELVVIGRISGEFTSKETLPVKLTRKAPCSVLYVPEESEPQRMQPEEINIVVPIDFSENSMDALELARDFAAAHEVPRITCLHVYDVPLGYYKRGKSYEEFSAIMKSNAEKRYEEFIREMDLKGVVVSFITRRLDKKAHKAINEIVHEHDIDLIVIGSRGREAAARFLLESVTEQLIRMTTVPLLSVRRKGKGMSFFEALLKL